MKREIIIFTVIFITGVNNMFFVDSKARAGNNSSQEPTTPPGDSQKYSSNMTAANEALYKKIIGGLMQDNADLKVNLSKLTDFNEQLDIEGLMQENADLKANLSKLKYFSAQLEKKAKKFYLKAQDNEQMRNDFAGFNKLLDRLKKEQIVLKKEKNNLEQNLRAFEEILRKEKASLAQELGAAYTKAKLFPLAIDAYLKSLSLNPDNAEIHYNLGLLYQYSEENTKESLYHFKKYLELKPNVKNKNEVEYLIAVLTESPKQEIK